MPKTYISLREVGRRLGVPPSTIVYYKDRFGKYIPCIGGGGRRRKYPLEAIDIFKKIREMYDKNQPAEQIEQELRHIRKKFPGDIQWTDYPFRENMYDSQSLACALNGIMEKMSAFLESQNFLQEEIKNLKTKISLLEKEKERLQDRHHKKISALEEERNELRRKKTEMQRYILKKIRSHNLHHHSRPTSLFLDLPLVIKSGQGEYLGVSGKSKKFTLKDLINLIGKNTGAKKTIHMSWNRQGAAWNLNVSSRDKQTGREQNLALFFEEKMTPKKNLVARLTRMSVDGKVVPAPFLLSLFKEIRNSFDN